LEGEKKWGRLWPDHTNGAEEGGEKANVQAPGYGGRMFAEGEKKEKGGAVPMRLAREKRRESTAVLGN